MTSAAKAGGPGAGRPSVEQLTAAAHEAAVAWELEVSELRLISLSENAVFRVDTVDGDRQILRLHRPGYNTRPEMDSELVWLEALREAGIDVPRPRQAGGGIGYQPVEVELAAGPDANADTGASARSGHRETRLAGLIEWIDGVNLEDLLEAATGSPADHRSTVVDSYSRIGRLLAELRHHGRRWDPPPDFTRRRWDADGLVGPDPLWGRFWEVPPDPGHRALFERARLTLHRQLADLATDRANFGLIHADLHTRNVMIDDDRMVVIDFDDSGFGWYIHELAMALHPGLHEPWYGDARRALVAGYRSAHPLPDHELALLPAFLTIRSLMIVAWLHARPELGLHDRLPFLIDQAVDDAERYLDSA